MVDSRSASKASAERKKKKNKNGEILDDGVFSYVSLFRMSASEGLWEEFSSRVIC